jgi:hypothetical protein
VGQGGGWTPHCHTNRAQDGGAAAEAGLGQHSAALLALPDLTPLDGLDYGGLPVHFDHPGFWSPM